MVATYMYKTAFNSADFGYGSTLSVFLVIECLVAVGIIQNAWDRRKEMGQNDKSRKIYLFVLCSM